MLEAVRQWVKLAVDGERKLAAIRAICGDGDKARRLDKQFRARAWALSREATMSFDSAYQREFDAWVRDFVTRVAT